MKQREEGGEKWKMEAIHNFVFYFGVISVVVLCMLPRILDYSEHVR